jgi:hypothetical protein
MKELKIFIFIVLFVVISSPLLAQDYDTSVLQNQLSESNFLSYFNISSYFNDISNFTMSFSKPEFIQETKEGTMVYILFNIIPGFGFGSYIQGDYINAYLLLASELVWVLPSYLSLYPEGTSTYNIEEPANSFIRVHLVALPLLFRLIGGISFPVNYSKGIDNLYTNFGALFLNIMVPYSGLGCFIQGNYIGGIISASIGVFTLGALIYSAFDVTNREGLFITSIVSSNIYIVVSSIASLVFNSPSDTTSEEDNIEFSIIPNGFRIGF